MGYIRAHVKTRRSLAILFIIVFIDLLGFGMVIPVMALYAERLGAPANQIGWLMTGYSAMQFALHANLGPAVGPVRGGRSSSSPSS